MLVVLVGHCFHLMAAVILSWTYERTVLSSSTGDLDTYTQVAIPPPIAVA